MQRFGEHAGRSPAPHHRSAPVGHSPSPASTHRERSAPGTCRQRETAEDVRRETAATPPASGGPSTGSCRDQRQERLEAPLAQHRARRAFSCPRARVTGVPAQTVRPPHPSVACVRPQSLCHTLHACARTPVPSVTGAPDAAHAPHRESRSSGPPRLWPLRPTTFSDSRPRMALRVSTTGASRPDRAGGSRRPLWSVAMRMQSAASSSSSLNGTLRNVPSSAARHVGIVVDDVGALLLQQRMMSRAGLSRTSSMSRL
jgi:hypothetical protein